jgi:non-lysosomal glucosylceramidase
LRPAASIARCQTHGKAAATAQFDLSGVLPYTGHNGHPQAREAYTLHANSFSIPEASWQRRLDAKLPAPGRPSNLTLRALPLRQMPFILRRIAAGARQRREAGWDPEDILFTASARRGPGPHQGVPVGGIGAGAIGRGWRGDFRRWQRRPGIYQHGAVWADQFSLFVQRPSQPGQAQVLYPGRPTSRALSTWRWELDGAQATYHALFPRAWTTYEQPVPGIRLACRQLSPVIPHNYRESSFPVGHFLWQIGNSGPDEAVVSLMYSWQNGMGTANDLAGGHSNRAFGLSLDGSGQGAQASGVELRHIQRQGRAYPTGQQPAQQEMFELPLAFAIAALAGEGIDVTWRTGFDPLGDGGELWRDFAVDGRLDNGDDTRPTIPGEAIAAAVAATITVPPGGVRQLAFALAWDAPLLRSGFGTAYHPRYTQFYGADGNAAPAIARDALLHAADWEAQIAAWQQPILDDPALPDWYKMALFNELYYLVDGGTLWVYPAPAAPSSTEAGSSGDSVPRPRQARSGPLRQTSGVLCEDRPEPWEGGALLPLGGRAEGGGDGDLGHFAYLEGHEYRMLNTYDVHFYASFALAMLWPRLELALQRDIAAATLADNPELVQSAWSGHRARRKLAGAVPHDVGWPDEDPWRLVNGYFLHDTNQWKDLNPKFALQVCRDFVATGDRQFVADVWPAVEAAMRYAAQFDRDGDGLIENDGEPDQTYDTWPVSGPSAYTGGLWLASLGAAAALADLLGKAELAGQYRATLARGQAAFQRRLWNGRYFNYDSSRNRHNDSIMADQLAGQWYACACDLPSIVEPEQARSALAVVFQCNVQGFEGGRLGAANGMRPGGKPDTTSMQSQEVWAGTTYALAAAMLHEGLVAEAFVTAEGVVRTTYEHKGYWFQTPEAWDRKGNYRSIAYMRPLAIWAMQWAWQRRTERADCTQTPSAL